VSAGSDYLGPPPTHRLDLLAPRFREAVEAAIEACNRTHGLDAMVYETYRSDELARLYHARGRSVRPPDTPVTNAPTNLHTWHGYGLAVDVVHTTRRWNAPPEWFAQVADVFRAHGCRWGGEWSTPDLPHFQWGACKPSPSDAARELMRTMGVSAVWAAVGAG
jgi:hypothetical protein